jgi:hypothetical protein
MSVKTVTVNITSHPLSREENGVEFIVKRGSSKFGELVVSKGGIRWKPKNKQDHHFISWTDLDKEARKYPKK